MNHDDVRITCHSCIRELFCSLASAPAVRQSRDLELQSAERARNWDLAVLGSGHQSLAQMGPPAKRVKELFLPQLSGMASNRETDRVLPSRPPESVWK